MDDVKEIVIIFILKMEGVRKTMFLGGRNVMIRLFLKLRTL